MGSVNRAILIGNLGKDAEVRFTKSGTAHASFSIATQEQWKDKDGQRQEKTEWHRISLWGKPAEALQQYLVKGKQVYVEGRLSTRQWEDKDGHKRYTTEIVAERVTLLGGGSRQRDEVEEDEGAGAEPVAAAAAPEQDDIPF